MQEKEVAMGMSVTSYRSPRANLLRGFAAVVLMAAVFLLVSAKGGAAELPTYTMVAKGGRLIPEVLNVPAGVRFKIVVRNEGPGAIEFESLELRKEKVLAEGAQSFVVIAPLRPGEYPFFDDFHPDTGRGRIVAKLAEGLPAGDIAEHRAS